MNRQSRLSDKFPVLPDVIERFLRQYDFDLRCAAPGIIRSFDPIEQTVKVQIALKELIYVEGKMSSVAIKELLDVPIVFPRAGNFVMAFPVTEGDECLVIFADMCIDSWWKLGEEKNSPQVSKGAQEQMSVRRHDLSDGFAILGPWSQPKVFEDYATDCMEIRTLNGENKIQVKDDSVKIVIKDDAYVEVKEDQIKINDKTTYVTIKDGEVKLLDGSTTVTIKNGEVTIVSASVKLGAASGLQKLIDARLIALYNAHTHQYNPGPGALTPTGVPVVPLVEASVATTNTEAK